MAVPPPITLTRSGSRPSSFMQLRATIQNASLISQKSISDAFSPALSRAFWLAGTGPAPIMVGSTPANPMERIVASGLMPFFLAVSLDIKTMDVAAAFKGEEIPAVMTPSFLKAGFNEAMPSSVESPRTA